MKIDIEVVGLARFDIDVVVKALVVTRGSDKRVSFRVQHCQYSSTTNVVRTVLALYVFPRGYRGYDRDWPSNGANYSRQQSVHVGYGLSNMRLGSGPLRLQPASTSYRPQYVSFSVLSRTADTVMGWNSLCR